MRLIIAAACGVLWTAPFAAAQKLELKFDLLAAKASNKIELNLDGALLRLFLGAAKEHDAAALLSGVQAIHVRTYEFDKAGAYSEKDLEPLRNQVAGQSRWSKLVSSEEDGATTEIYVAAQGDKVAGCLIIAAEQRELSVIYLEGTLALAKMRRLMDGDTRHGLGALFGDHP